MTWATSVPILVFLGLSVLELGPMYATDRQTDRRQTDRRQTKHRLMPPPCEGGGITTEFSAHPATKAVGEARDFIVYSLVYTLTPFGAELQSLALTIIVMDSGRC